MKFNTQQFDLKLLICTMCLLAFGLVVMASASAEISYQHHGQSLYYFFRQLVHIVVAIVLMLLLANINLDRLKGAHWFFLIAGLALLFLVLMPGVGYSVNGSQRWINLGFVRVHASDFARTFLLIFCAAWVSGYLGRKALDWREVLLVAVLVAVAGALMYLQPDLGAAIACAVTLFGMMFLAGARLPPMVSVVAAVGVVVGWMIVSSSYRLSRMTGFLEPFADPYDSGFQLSQSQIAIGTGGMDGVGIGNSVQKMSFLPEAHNDFIFSILAEEFGFIGISFVVMLYLVLILRILQVANKASQQKEYFAFALSAGIALWFAVQTLTNIGVATGLLPTTGISLPLISYGGANMVIALAQIGIVLAVHRRLQINAAGRPQLQLH